MTRSTYTGVKRLVKILDEYDENFGKIEIQFNVDPDEGEDQIQLDIVNGDILDVYIRPGETCMTVETCKPEYSID